MGFEGFKRGFDARGGFVIVVGAVRRHDLRRRAHAPGIRFGLGNVCGLCV